MHYPPGPRSFLGSTLRAMQRDPLAFLTGVARTYGDLSHFKFGPVHAYFFNHPDLIREVLVTQARSFEKGRALRRAKILLGEGLLTSEGDFHLRQRRLAQPAFHRDRVARYAETMIDLTLQARERWRDGAEIDVATEMMRLTLSIVARTLFGVDVADEADEIGEALSALMETFKIAVSPFSEFLQKLRTPRVRRLEAAIARLDATVYRIIEQRRASGEDRGDLLSMLLLARDTEADGGRMSDKQVRDEAMTLFLAGHETTANALAWTWMFLSRNADAERAMHEEIDRVLAGRAPRPDDVPRLPMVEMVLAESMRLRPPAWIIGRLAKEDVTIGGTRICKGSVGIVCQYVMHRDPRFWPDAERFDPLRFTPELRQSRPKFAYFPFGAGTRICIGEGFAWTEGILLLATIAQQWRIRVTSEEIGMLPRITLRPKGGMRGTVSRR